MRQSGRPIDEAVVAAPIRKLCDEYEEGSKPTYDTSCLIAELSVRRKRGYPEERVNRC